MTHICTFQHQLQLYFNQSWSCVLCNVFLSSLTFHSSSSLLICCADTCLALNCSCSEGTFTNHGKNCLSWINGCHWDGSLLIDQKRVEIVFKNYKRLIGVFCSAAVLLYFHDFFSQYFELYLPVHILQVGWWGAWLTTQQHNYGVSFSRYKSQQENVTTPAIVTLKYGLPQWSILMQRHLLRLCSNKMVDNVAVTQRIHFTDV